MSYRDRLFADYRATHAVYADGADELRTEWFRDHVARNYRRLLPLANERPRLLEVGAGRGFLLAALREAGYGDLTGVDLSLEDVAYARDRLQLEVVLSDAREYLRGNPDTFDVVVAKAVLEHVRKDEVLPFLEDMRDALRPGGRVIIEVPNMDWLFAAHERFLDFTHEVGFTRESLAQLLRSVFGNAQVHAAEEPMPQPWKPHLRRRVLRPLVRALVGVVLHGLGEGAAETLWQVRSIIGVARKEGA